MYTVRFLYLDIYTAYLWAPVYFHTFTYMFIHPQVNTHRCVGRLDYTCTCHLAHKFTYPGSFQLRAASHYNMVINGS